MAVKSSEYLKNRLTNKGNIYGVTYTDVGADKEGSASTALESAKKAITESESKLEELVDSKTVIDDTLSSSSTNPVQNKVILVALDGKQPIITGGASTVTTLNLTSNRSLISDAEGKISASAVSSTELGYLSGVNSNIQNQLDNKDTKGSAEQALTDAKSYTNTKIAELINGAPNTLDTLGEVANAMAESADVVSALESAVGSKASASDLTSHTSNKSNPHGVTLAQVGAASSSHTHGNITNSGAIGSTANLPVFTGTSGKLETKTAANALTALGLTATAAELNYVDGVTSNIQTQLNGKAPSSHGTHVTYSTSTPLVAGTAAVGSAANVSRGDHVHPAQTTISGNAGSATKWATARNINGMSVDGTANRVNYGTCSTAAATAAKTVACTGFALVTGAEITVKFTVTNTASSPTLNVNSTGAKAIYYRGAAISAGYLAANRTYTFRYNGTQYELVGDVDTNTTYTLSNITGTLAIAKGGTGSTTAASAVTALGAADIGTIGTSIPSNSNLDDYTTPGTYYSSQASVSTTLTNTPTTGSGYKLIVMRNYATNRIWQFAFPVGNTFYMRQNDAGTWTAWKSVGGNATTSVSGYLSAADKTKLNNTNVAYGTCSTAAATAAKVITISGNTNWSLTTGSRITVKFTATNTAQNPTFNVNGTGAKSVWYNTALITTSNLGYGGTANRPMEFVYDGTQYVFVGWSLDNNTTYSNASLGSGYGTCATAEATVEKAVTLSRYSLVTGGTVAVKFTYAVPASATMNINSKGAKAIYHRGAAIAAGIIKAGDVATFIYNGSQYHLISIDRQDIPKLTTARTIDGVSFNGTANIIHYGTCSTAAATAAKTVSCTGFTLATGARIMVKFTVTNTAASPTLNVNSTGAKAIMYRGSAISAGHLAANRVHEFVYDGTNYLVVGDLDTTGSVSRTSATITLSGSNLTSDTVSSVYAYKYGSVVEFHVAGYPSITWTRENTTLLFTLPEGYRPKQQKTRRIFGTTRGYVNDYVNYGMLMVKTNGEVSIAPTNANWGTSLWFNACMTYII